MARNQAEVQCRTYRQPLSVIGCAGREKRLHRVVPGNDKAGKVCEKLPAEVEHDQEEIEGNEADEGIGLGNAGLLLEVVQGGVF
jgi:hypothetical protein